MESQNKITSQKENDRLFDQVKNGLYIAAQVVLSIPFKLPSKIVQVAKYVSLVVTLLDQQAGKDSTVSNKEELENSDEH